MKKRLFYTEAAYLAGLILLAFGTALTAKGGFGISMVVAPAYLLHLRLAAMWPWFSFGVAEYILQAFVLLLLVIMMRKVRLYYLLSFVSTIVYGAILDMFIRMLSVIPADTVWQQLAAYIPGVLLCCLGISLLFRSYFPPAAYELFVKCVAARAKKSLHICKTWYDIVSLCAALALSFIFFGTVRGIGIGTVACALVYGCFINTFGRLLEHFWHFTDKLPYRKYFEESEN